MASRNSNTGVFDSKAHTLSTACLRKLKHRAPTQRLYEMMVALPDLVRGNSQMRKQFSGQDLCFSGFLKNHQKDQLKVREIRFSFLNLCIGIRTLGFQSFNYFLTIFITTIFSNILVFLNLIETEKMNLLILCCMEKMIKNKAQVNNWTQCSDVNADINHSLEEWLLQKQKVFFVLFCFVC